MKSWHVFILFLYENHVFNFKRDYTLTIHVTRISIAYTTLVLVIVLNEYKSHWQLYFLLQILLKSLKPLN